MATALGTVLEGVACYHQYLAVHPEKAVNAPSWARLSLEAQTRWRERAAKQRLDGADLTAFNRIFRSRNDGV